MGWQTHEKAGRRFDVLMQEQEADCGLCCVAMVVNLLGMGKPSSGNVKMNMLGGYMPSTKDRAGMVPTAIAVVKPGAATHSQGTYLTSLQRALKKWHIDSDYMGGSPDVASAIMAAQAGHPIICHVTWASGGGHWVVITHSMGLSHYVLDPAYGLQINSSLQNYEGLKEGGTPGSVQKATYGRWTGEWLKIR